MPTPEEFAATVLEVVGGTSSSTDYGTVKVKVDPDKWVESIETARDELGLAYLSFISVIDWSNEVAIGDPPAQEVEERYEMLCAIGDMTEGNLVIFSADLPKDEPTIGSLTDVYPGAEWHEREAHEMFSISFTGLRNSSHIYLPEGFVGHPLKKSYALLAREVKPWPGDVDVEDMPEAASDGPSTENPEA